MRHFYATMALIGVTYGLARPADAQSTHHTYNEPNVGIGLSNYPYDYAWSRLMVGTGMNGVALDDLSARNGFPTLGGACIGFNAAYGNDGYFRMGSNGTSNGGAVMWAGTDGSLAFSTLPSGLNYVSPTTTSWVSGPQMVEYQRLTISATGAVRIGRPLVSPSPHLDYKLSVQGKLVAQSVFVTISNWPDYVFAPGFRPQPLPELETYLRTHHHLPAVAPAPEVEANGLDLGTMQAQMLRQLEELTLHVIELNKQNQRLAAEVEKLAAGCAAAHR